MRKNQKVKNQKVKNQKVKSNKVYILTAVVILVALSIFLFTNNKNNFNESEEKIIRIPMQELSTNANFYEEEINGVEVKFFAIKDANGEVKTAFDACDVCYNSKKGYTQDGDYMVCNNCGNRYHVSGLGTENKFKGGCWPSYLESEVNDDYLEIKLSSLEKGMYKFT
jgi:uncharacterized membrane protein